MMAQGSLFELFSRIAWIKQDRALQKSFKNNKA